MCVCACVREKTSAHDSAPLKAIFLTLNSRNQAEKNTPTTHRHHACTHTSILCRDLPSRGREASRAGVCLRACADAPDAHEVEVGTHVAHVGRRGGVASGSFVGRRNLVSGGGKRYGTQQMHEFDHGSRSHKSLRQTEA